MATKQTSSQTFEILAKLKVQFALNPTDILRTTIENTERRANSLLSEEMGKRLKNFEDKHQGAEWWTLMEKLYPVTKDEARNAWVVTSNAREWEHTKDWEFTYKVEALEKVRQLIMWKHDARKRGFGDKDRDVEYATEKLNAQAA